MYIIVDGIDGSGKGTLISILAKVLEEKGLKIFDARKFWKKHNRHPYKSEWIDSQVIITGEPTYVGAGAKIRDAMIKNEKPAAPEETANAFSEDRLEHYNSLIIPAVTAQKHILQERGVSSTLSYQPLTSPYLTREYLAELPGNKLALNNAPDMLILTTLDPSTALLRLAARSEKQDDSIFEKKEFLEKLTEEFEKKDFKKYFLEKGVKIMHFSTADNLDIMENRARELAYSLNLI